MRQRSVQFVVLMLLLSSLHLAGAAALSAGEYSLGGRTVGVRLHEGAAVAERNAPALARLNGTLDTAIPVEFLVATRTVWTMRQPAAHAMAIQSTTSFAEPAPSARRSL